MFQRSKFYNFANNQIIVGGISIGGFEEDGGVEYEFGSDIEEDAVGADGEVTFSHLNDDRLYVNIRLKETSKSYNDLGGLLLAQLTARRNLGAALFQVPYLHIDPNTGDEVASGEAIFMHRVGPNKGRVAGERVFRLCLPYGARNIVNGLLLT